MIFISFGRTITNAGLSQALIQRKNISIIEECSVFYFNLFVGLLFTLIVNVTSNTIAVYYDLPQLNYILKAVSFWFILNSLGIIHDVKLTRDLNFKAKFYINIVAIVVASCTSIVLAICGLGVWALVTQIILSQFVRALMLWQISLWRPLILFDWGVLKKLIPYGLNILVSSIFTGFRINIFAIVIGKVYTTTQLGYYNRANQLQNISAKTLTTSLQNVLFPVFSQLQDDLNLLKASLKKAIVYLFLFIAPLMVFFNVCAEDIIVVLLTEKWIESAGYLKLICWIGLLYPLQMMNLNALKAINLSNKFLHMTLLWDILSIVSAIITSFYSIEVMIIGQVCITFLSYLVNVALNGKYYGYLIGEQLLNLLPLTMINLVFFILLKFLLPIIPDINIYLLILTKILMSSIIYFLLVFFLNNKLYKQLRKEIRLILKKDAT